ncbi:class I SAM-dependent methyltransferase [Isoptericola sp. NEAU-Y5]|uniref:Class I SAM-dependent methyltransferase n=1 Tax=Isoptericola luteus TaxID=2879484 RepID=A0ABS7ZDU9_9MICO|nr:class I SAM-dependent methyltransferase [Isoptericola sp. NEAU-Y5]MCA5893098.1 class I SAM-dependent methyltransferase [Isoptericola sp. NEAU-Y5]
MTSTRPPRPARPTPSTPSARSERAARADVATAVSAAYDARAATYDESRMHRDLAREVAAFCALDGELGRVRDVLDVATGTGLVLRALRTIAPAPLRQTGVDLSPDMLAVAHRELPGATLVRADAAALPLADASVDLVTCVTALHLMPAPDAVLSEWARVLRPGGRAVTATFTGFARPARPARTQHAFDVHHDRFATSELLAARAARAGLRLRRHAAWQHVGGDAFLLGELAPDGPGLPARTPGP